MPLEIQNYKPVGKGCLIATCDIKLPLWGNFMIYGITIWEKDNKRWISFPSKEYEKEGQKKYFQHCRFENENMTEAFRKEFFKELEKYQKANNPSVFDMPEKQTPNPKSSPDFPTSIKGQAKPSNDDECPF